MGCVCWMNPNHVWGNSTHLLGGIIVFIPFSSANNIDLLDLKLHLDNARSIDRVDDLDKTPSGRTRDRSRCQSVNVRHSGIGGVENVRIVVCVGMRDPQEDKSGDCEVVRVVEADVSRGEKIGGRKRISETQIESRPCLDGNCKFHFRANSVGAEPSRYS